MGRIERKDWSRPKARLAEPFISRKLARNLKDGSRLQGNRVRDPYTDEGHHTTLRNFYTVFGDVRTLGEVIVSLKRGSHKAAA